MAGYTSDLFNSGHFVGRVHRPDRAGPALVALRAGRVIDITTRAHPTMRDLLETDDPVAVVDAADGEDLGAIDDLLASAFETAGDPKRLHLLAPCDLQAVKACGVTFARSMIERVIEEKAAGNAALAASIRTRVTAIVGDSLRDLKAVPRRPPASRRR